MSGEYREQLQVFLLTPLRFCDLLLYSLISDKILSDQKITCFFLEPKGSRLSPQKADLSPCI